MLMKFVKNSTLMLFLLFAMIVGLIYFDLNPSIFVPYIDPLITAMASVICTETMLSYHSKYGELWRLVAIFIWGSVILCLVIGSACISFLIGFFVQGIFLIYKRAVTGKL